MRNKLQLIKHPHTHPHTHTHTHERDQNCNITMEKNSEHDSSSDQGERNVPPSATPQSPDSICGREPCICGRVLPRLAYAARVPPPQRSSTEVTSPQPVYSSSTTTTTVADMSTSQNRSGNHSHSVNSTTSEPIEVSRSSPGTNTSGHVSKAILPSDCTRRVIVVHTFICVMNRSLIKNYKNGITRYPFGTTETGADINLNYICTCTETLDYEEERMKRMKMLALCKTGTNINEKEKNCRNSRQKSKQFGWSKNDQSSSKYKTPTSNNLKNRHRSKQIRMSKNDKSSSKYKTSTSHNLKNRQKSKQVGLSKNDKSSSKYKISTSNNLKSISSNSTKYAGIIYNIDSLTDAFKSMSISCKQTEVQDKNMNKKESWPSYKNDTTYINKEIKESLIRINKINPTAEQIMTNDKLTENILIEKRKQSGSLDDLKTGK